MKKSLHLVSLGCTKNLVDSEVMLGRLRDYALTDAADEADVIIVNTCGFIDAAKEESISTLLDLHRQRRDDSILVMSGCLSERYKDALRTQLPEIDIFTGVGDYDRIDHLIAQRQSTFSPEVYLIGATTDRVITGSRYHAYIKIAEGCDQNCAFCAIPSFKGRLQSRPIHSIVTEVRRLTQSGFCDFTFVSQDSSSYGRDLGLQDGLIALMRAIETVAEVRSARILYLYPSTTRFALIDAIAQSPIFQTYYDMPIQHIANPVLKTMKRGFGSQKTRALLEHMRAHPDAFIRTSVIAGHPGEREEDFEALCRFMEDFGFDRFNTFAYSNEESTRAYTLEQLPREIIEARAQTLGAIAQKITRQSLSKMVGKTVELFVDGPSSEHEYLLSARPVTWAAEIDGEILINDTNDRDIQYGQRYRAEVTEMAGDVLLARLIHTADNTQ